MERPEKGALGIKRFLWDIRHRRERFRQMLGVLFSIVVALLGQPPSSWYWTGLPLVVAGILTRLWASGHVKKDKVLATDGPYGFVRHPLYVGNLLIGFGFAISSGLLWSFPVLIIFLLLFYPPAIRQEDSKLHGLFKEQWEPWRERTRALIPRLTPFQRGQESHWSFGQSLKQNGEPIIAAFLAVLMYYLYLNHV